VRDRLRQVVWPTTDDVSLTVVESDMSADEADRYLMEALTEPFSVTTPPLWRAVLLPLGQQRHLFAIIISHLICDGWSAELLLREWPCMYEAALHGRDPTHAVDPIQQQFGDFARWERDQEFSPQVERFWREQLSPAPPLPRLPITGWRDGDQIRYASFRLPLVPAETYHAVRRLARDEGVTPGSALRAAALMALAPYLDDAVVLGVVRSRRGDPDLNSVVGPVADYLPIRVELTGATERDLLHRVDRAWSDARRHAAPLGLLWRAMAPHPNARLCDITINQRQEAPASPVVLPTPSGDSLAIVRRPSLGEAPATFARETLATLRLGYELRLTSRGVEGELWGIEDAFPAKTLAGLGHAFTDAVARIAAPAMP
jgi:hypothetical protein